MRLDPRTVRNRLGVRTLYEYLSHVCASPAEFLQDTDLRAAMSSQGKLSTFARPSASIMEMSLNTAKHAAEIELQQEGGYAALDRLRRMCLTRIQDMEQRVAKSNKDTKSGLRAEIDSLKELNQALREDLMVLSHSFFEAIRNGRSYASNADNATQERCKKDSADLIAGLSLTRTVQAKQWIADGGSGHGG